MRSTEKLVEIIRMLAAPAEIQLAPPPADDLGSEEIAVDLGLEMECWSTENLKKTVGDKAAELLTWIDLRLAELSGPGLFWEDDAFRNDPRWDEIRRKARMVLREIGEPWMMPMCSAGFVDGKMEPGFIRPAIPKELAPLVADL